MGVVATHSPQGAMGWVRMAKEGRRPWGSGLSPKAGNSIRCGCRCHGSESTRASSLGGGSSKAGWQAGRCSGPLVCGSRSCGRGQAKLTPAVPQVASYPWIAEMAAFASISHLRAPVPRLGLGWGPLRPGGKAVRD